jgi:hypothetical protein
VCPRAHALAPACYAKAVKWNAVWLNSVSPIDDKFASEATMAQEFRPGEIVPQSGIYTKSSNPH